MMELPNHLLPWATVKQLLKGAWDEGHSSGWQDAHELDEDTLTPNPYDEEDA